MSQETDPTAARPPPAVHAPVVHIDRLPPWVRQEIARVTRTQRVQENVIDHHDNMIDALVDTAGASSQQMTRVVGLLGHTMESLRHLYMMMYLVLALVVMVIGWIVWWVNH